MIEAGELAWARPAASEAEQVARTITNPNSQAEALASLTPTLAEADELERARMVVASACRYQLGKNASGAIEPRCASNLRRRAMPRSSPPRPKGPRSGRSKTWPLLNAIR
ncbi:hypothetical protein Phou_078290 [Phytohabitans houttuyneae]|uniref:Uncharacterized protein n=1 Tax=Phytohabitans houttuyneae TaxID=1076126 RepID=A0A6V8KN92_9ACTN|nr:hypothetical protein Phou_078290 [Phytohabitans houttuyneae]